MMRILLVDDDAVNIALLQMKIARINPLASVKIFNNAADTLACIKEEGPPDLLLLDLNMPVLNGFEFLAELQRRNVMIPSVYVFSSFCRENEREILFRLGYSNFVEKPLTTHMLKTIIGSYNHSLKAG